jgi:site-specific DNA-cytosine methylase
MKVLVACEYSGVVRDAFIKQGHNAISCDLLETDAERITGVDYLGGHYKGDVKDIINDGWDLMIAHPPCTYLTVSGARWFYHPDDKHLPYEERRPHPMHPNRRQLQEEALEFIQFLMDAPIEKIAIENPVGVISSRIRKPEQIIQPYMFGHSESKKTCLWLKNLQPLQPTNIVEEEERVVYASGRSMPRWYADAYKLPPEERWKVRSATFPGIAKAMAEQWGKDG